jgi:hypothetical protein
MAGARRRMITMHRWIAPACMIWCAMFASVAASASTVPETAAQASAKRELLADVRSQALSAGASAVNADAIVSALQRLSLVEIRDLGDARNADRLQRLVPGAVTNSATPATQVVGGAREAGSATQRQMQDLQAGLGGFVDTRGQAASCYACPKGGFAGSRSGFSPHDDQAGRTIVARNGDRITRYSDGSARIERPDGTTEYLNSESRLVDARGKEILPNPDAERPSGVVTRDDVKGIEARIGANVTPTGETGNRGTGGGMAATRADATGTRGLFTENRTAGTLTTAQTQEILRVAVEKLGPRIGHQ